MSTVLITGCSSGFGLATAQLFLDRGWNVVATMRNVEANALPPSDLLRVVALDVTKPAQVSNVLSEVGQLDVLVNNAGFGVPAPVELIDLDTARAQFETNTLGTLSMVQAVLPRFRAQRAGVIINVTSSTTLKVIPLVGLYRASKAAVAAFTESLALEVKPFGIRAHIVIPGKAPETRFADNAKASLRGLDDPEYGSMVRQGLANMMDASGPLTQASDVAEAIWSVATDNNSDQTVAAGADAKEWLGKARR